MSSNFKKVLTIAIALVVVAAAAVFFGHKLKATDDLGEYVEAVEAEVAVEEIAVNADDEAEEAEEVAEETAEPEVGAIVPSAEGEAQPGSGPSVKVTTNPEGINAVAYGTQVQLHAELSGFEGLNYSIQWQKSTDDVNWENIEGENGVDYFFVMSSETDGYHWRVLVDWTE